LPERSAFMRRIIISVLLLVLVAALISCSSSSKIAPPVMPNISGPWEIVLASSTQPGYSTGLEIAMQEGTMLDTSGPGSYVYTGQISAASSQINFVGLTLGAHPTSAPHVTFGGNCAPAASDSGNSLIGAISGLGGSMNFSFTENGNVFNVNAILDASGTTIDSGTYTSQSGNVCVDSGTITSGKIVSKLSGTYTGQLCEPLDSSCESGAGDSATVTLSQSGTTLTVSMLLTGADNTSFTLSGPVTGNEFSVTGTFEGTTVAYEGYYELTYDSSDSMYDTQTLYLVNAADPSQQAGLHTVPVIP
jgi:hypothetical protein